MLALAIIVLINAKEIKKNPGIIGKLFFVSIVAMAFTTGYWLPAFEQAVRIKFGAIYSNVYDISEEVLGIGDLFTQFIGPFLFVVFIISIILYGVMDSRGKKIDKGIWSILVTSVVIIALTCSKAFWRGEAGNILGFFQYTRRFIYILTCLMIIFIVMIIGELQKNYNIALLEDKRAGSLLTVIIGLILIVFTRCDNKLDFYDLNSYNREAYGNEIFEEQLSVSGGEWLPYECQIVDLAEDTVARANDYEAAAGAKYNHSRYYVGEFDLEKEYYDVPYIYYYGYRAYVIDENQRPVRELDVRESVSNNGYVRVFMPDDGHGIGNVLVTYRMTTIQKFAYLISILTGIIIIGRIVISWRSSKSF